MPRRTLLKHRLIERDIPSLKSVLPKDFGRPGLDRLLHHSHVLSIKGRSYRLRDLEQAGTEPV